MFSIRGVSRLNKLNIFHIMRSNSGFLKLECNYSTKIRENDEEIDKPIKFSTSGALKWQAKMSRRGYKNERLWYEPYVILASISAFLIYFTILREENDLDEELNKSLYSRIKGLEEHQLKLVLKYNQEHNLETASIIARLKELEDLKNK